MKVNLANAVSKLSSRTNVPMVCSEAIMNGLHANADEITIEFIECPTVEEELDIDDENKVKLSKLIIKDNGAGFSEEDITSFSNLYSDHKRDIGGKGMGRLTYLKVFRNIDIESCHALFKSSCQFTEDYEDESNFTKTPINTDDENGTQITYSQIVLPKNHPGLPLNFDQWVDRIYNQMMPYLYLSEKNITLKFKQKQGKTETSSRMILSKDLPEMKVVNFDIQEGETSVKEKIKFKFHYVIESNELASDIDSMEGYYCANKRATLKFGHKDTGKNQIQLGKIKGHKVLFFLESQYLDQKAEGDRSGGFDIYANDPDAGCLLSWSMINDKLNDHIEKVLPISFPDLQKEGEQLIESVKNEYLHLADYVDKPTKIGGLYTKKYYREKAEGRFKKEKDDFRKNRDTWRPEKVIKKASSLAGKELIEYIQMRDNVITQMEKVEQDKGSNENELHSLILDMKKTANDNTAFSLDNNNLWLIDDKFMGFSEVASDVDINTILGLDSQNNESNVTSLRRPDIAAFYRDERKTKLVLFELKKTSAGTFDASKGIDQLSLYARKFRDSGAKEIYLYLLSAIDEDAKVVLEERGFETIFSREGQYMFGTVGKTPCFLSVLDAQAVISDARARNQTFINMIKKNVILNEPS